MTIARGFLRLLVVAVLSSGGVSGEYMKNSIGPRVSIGGLYGIGYERSLSEFLSIGTAATTSGDVDFIGARLMLDRRDTSVQIRPALGFCIARVPDDDDMQSHDGRRHAYLWFGIDLNVSFWRISTVLEASMSARNGLDDFDEASPILALGILYMF